MNNNTRNLVLCSGGPDGAIAAAIENQKAPGSCTFLHFNYGQMARHRELSAVSELSQKMSIPLMTVDLRDSFSAMNSRLLHSGIGDVDFAELKGKSAEVPMRNLILLSVAAGIAQSGGFNYLIIGNIAGGAYWDNKPAFSERFDQILELASESSVYLRVRAPLVGYTKGAAFVTGGKLGVPLGDTWSCYGGEMSHCGLCASCVGRKKAFVEANIPDPTHYAN